MRVAGRYGHSPEGSRFVDTACETSQSVSEVVSAEAMFNGYDEGAVKAFDKLHRFLKKH